MLKLSNYAFVARNVETINHAFVARNVEFTAKRFGLTHSLYLSIILQTKMSERLIPKVNFPRS